MVHKGPSMFFILCTPRFLHFYSLQFVIFILLCVFLLVLTPSRLFVFVCALPRVSLKALEMLQVITYDLELDSLKTPTHPF